MDGGDGANSRRQIMLTELKTETVEYPPEVVERRLNEAEVTMQQFDAGDITYTTEEEPASELGSIN
jgi:hypothetical protein